MSTATSAAPPPHSGLLPPAIERALVAAALVALPAITLYLVTAIARRDGALVVPDGDFLRAIAPPTPRALAIWAGWFLLQAALAALLPGRTIDGVPLEAGGGVRALSYRMNGWRAFVITLALAVALVAAGVVPATLLHDEIGPLLAAANLGTFAVCAFIYALGRRQATAEERRTHPLLAFFHGATLNPRSGSFDWKFFCESRPGMILWVLIDASMAAAQYERFGRVSDSMLLVCAFQLLYVADYFWLEEAILTTWDIRHERFGFMLCWGCLVWIPFTFSLQAMWLADHPIDLPDLAVAGLIGLNGLGYFIFRQSNLQKHRFRGDPTRPVWGRPPDYIATARGTKLLVAGWWGVARHANYLGDLMMGLAWCATTGFNRVIPYFYFVYFVILLVHRERRDNDHCARKYGADWEAYTRRVRWRILPGVY